MHTKDQNNKQSQKGIDQISSPDVETKHVSNAEFVPIQPFRGKNSSPDSKRTSISNDISTFSSSKSDDFESDATSLKSQRSEGIDSGISSLPETSNPYSSSESLFSTGSAAKNISTEEPFESFKNRGSHGFVYESNVDYILSSPASNDANHNSRSLSSFTTFFDTKPTSDEKISTNESRPAKNLSIQDKPIKLAKKVAPPTVPTFNIDKNLSNILNSEKKKELHKAKQKPQDKILKGDIAKIKEAISTAKSKVDLKERYNSLLNQLGKVQTHFNHNKKLHPDLKEAITELRKERWASQTNILAIKLDKG